MLTQYINKCRLNARMITPVIKYGDGPIPEPKFVGYQEFFKDFIDISSCPAFNQCLIDFVSSEIDLVLLNSFS